MTKQRIIVLFCFIINVFLTTKRNQRPLDVEQLLPASDAGYVLGSVKTSNATYGHHGEMAWQQKPG